MEKPFKIAENEKKEKILEYIKAYPGKCSKSIANHFGMPVYSLNNYYIKELASEGKITKDRSARIVKYYSSKA